MKQRIFTLVMLLALVFVAGSAMARNEINVFQGGTYSYRVTDVAATTNNATATVAFGHANVQISQPSFTITAGDPAKDLDFNLTFETAAHVYTPAGTYQLTVTVDDDVTPCSNYIILTITVEEAPSMTIDISTLAAGGCQAFKASIPTDGSVDAASGGTNNLSFSVKTTTTAVGIASRAYTFACSGATGATGAKTADGDFDVSFTTVEGAGVTVTGSISGTPTFTMDTDHGGQTYNMTLGTGSVAVVYSPVPTIGSFTD